MTTTTIDPKYLDSPLTRASHASLPLLIEAYERLYRAGAPKSARLSEKIGEALERLIDLAGEVEAYGNSWPRDGMGEIADKLRLACLEYTLVDLG